MSPSWWAVPCASRADFDKLAAGQVPRMAASQIGYKLTIWTTSDVGTLSVRRASSEDDVECSARR